MTSDARPTESQVLGPRERAVFNRFGDIMLPRNGAFPAFSELGCIEHVDDLVRYAPPEDIAQLRVFLKILHFCPNFVLRAIVALCQRANRFPEPIATNLRLLDMGTRSVVVSLYYSGKAGAAYNGKTPLELIGFELNVVRSGTADRA